MISAAALADAYNRNVILVKNECKGVTHAESLLQPQPRGNCLNWTVGHMLTARNTILAALDAPFRAPTDALMPYERNGDPITEEGEGVIELAQLLAWLETGQTHISEKLATLTDSNMEKEVEVGTTGHFMPLNELVFFLYFHDTYHTGQTSYLRQLAGKNDKTL